MTPSSAPSSAPLRVTAVLAVGAIVVLAPTGLEILAAHPWFGPVEAPYGWLPGQGWVLPSWLRVGHTLAGARALHLTAAAALLVIAVVHAGILGATGRWRRHPGPAAFAAIGLVLVLVVSGLGLWQPVQLRVLVMAVGGDDAARAVHFLALVLLVVVAAVAVGWRLSHVLRARARSAAGAASASGPSS